MKNQLASASRYLFREWIKPLALVAAIVLPLKSAVADWNWVPSGSMRPTILEGELVFINKLAYDLKVPFTTHHLAEWDNPQRGEIAVFYSPKDGTRLVKRVIGLPGDRIALHANQLTINGQPVAWSAANETWRTYATAQEKSEAIATTEMLGTVPHPILSLPRQMALRDFDEITVPAGQYFMMGDNRDCSFDSRYFGFVPRQQIIGRANAVVLSFNTDRYLLPRLSRCFSRLL
ncbi:MAG: signal peptidase I [Verrucomicrobia bacterium]|nr:signal peptidase I [Verrucomicrobiota bacterium]